LSYDFSGSCAKVEQKYGLTNTDTLDNSSGFWYQALSGDGFRCEQRRLFPLKSSNDLDIPLRRRNALVGNRAKYWPQGLN